MSKIGVLITLVLATIAGTLLFGLVVHDGPAIMLRAAWPWVWLMCISSVLCFASIWKLLVASDELRREREAAADRKRRSAQPVQAVRLERYGWREGEGEE